jgi:hypothetical protein
VLTGEDMRVWWQMMLLESPDDAEEPEGRAGLLMRLVQDFGGTFPESVAEVVVGETPEVVAFILASHNVSPRVAEQVVLSGGGGGVPFLFR